MKIGGTLYNPNDLKGCSKIQIQHFGFGAQTKIPNNATSRC